LSCLLAFSFFVFHFFLFSTVTRAIVISHHNAKFTNNGNGDALPSFEGKVRKKLKAKPSRVTVAAAARPRWPRLLPRAAPRGGS